ncbi:MAG: bifunctional oligoribonuclease/PAP phosphatase NrnA [Bacilli bacterium]
MTIKDEIKNVTKKVSKIATEKVKDGITQLKTSETYRDMDAKLHNDKYRNIKVDIYTEIKAHDTIVIYRHRRPDGDAIGTTLGLRDILRQSFPDKKIYSVGDGIPEYLQFVGEEDQIDVKSLKGFLAIVVDTANLDRAVVPGIENAHKIIKIDHHIPVEQFGDINYVRENYASCSLMIMDFARSFSDLVVNAVASRYLYIATITDTGRFKYAGVDSYAFVLASEMVKKDFDIEKIYASLDSKSRELYMFKGYIIKNTKFSENGVAYMHITKKIIKKFNISVTDASGFINIMDSVAGSPIWILFIDNNDEIRVRLRSRMIAIDSLANAYNGGGHANACGATLYDKKDIAKLVGDADKLLASYKEKNPELK